MPSIIDSKAVAIKLYNITVGNIVPFGPLLKINDMTTSEKLHMFGMQLSMILGGTYLMSFHLVKKFAAEYSSEDVSEDSSIDYACNAADMMLSMGGSMFAYDVVTTGVKAAYMACCKNVEGTEGEKKPLILNP